MIHSLLTKIWRGWGRRLVYRIATIYDVVLQRLYVRTYVSRRVWWMTSAMLCSEVFRL